jgi:hypothetical protein
MKNDFQKKRTASFAKPGAKSAYDPKLDTYIVRPSAKLAEAKKIFALWDFKSFVAKFEKEHGK